ncbi:glycosyltransferase family 2 protein [Solimonas sp. SE-A11]|uniref:glycosyltransferase family 2 protein n=1 Tax=Solimonas sp. SE-A11 TaxID=3054954 RepID=UPI00259D2B5F|nr:glycosyltransferase [Solimonas sp. SE-A11]MDM4772323.1 glycosyltransferase [Solimonas sp. SE-A11]
MRERLIKPLGRYFAAHPRLNPWVAPFFNGLVKAQLGVVRLADRMRAAHGGNDALLDQLTLVIKTFERRPLLQQMLSSIRRHYPRIHIVVVDDSCHPEPIDGVEYVTLPFDSGVSAGRNAGLARVRTPYTMILDDDFVFYSGSDLLRSLRRIAAEPRIDILGGIVITLPMMEWNDSSRTPIYKSQAIAPSGELGGLPLRAKVPNFFIARTARLAQVGWDDRLKRLDHLDFFTRADGVLRTVLDPSLRCLHPKSLFDRHYLSFRLDYAADSELLRKRYPGVETE